MSPILGQALLAARPPANQGSNPVRIHGSIFRYLHPSKRARRQYQDPRGEVGVQEELGRGFLEREAFSIEGSFLGQAGSRGQLRGRAELGLSHGQRGTRGGASKDPQTSVDSSLVELLFQYGRYLLIACSRPGSQPSNLQGIWNKDTQSPWDGAPHLNINLQMNYWPSLSCNLKECQEPLFDFISSLSVNGNRTATVNYGGNGWVAHQVSDIWAKTSPDRGEAVWALW